MKKFLVAVAFISCLPFAGCKTNEGDPKAVLVQFFDALAKNNIATARTLATKDSKSMIDMMEMAMNMGKDSKEANKFDKSKLKFGEAKIEGDKATIPVKDSNSGETINYTLKKEDGKWKVAFDKSSMMEMGMDKMNEKGINPADSMGRVMEELKNINMDSLKDLMKNGMEDLDSARKQMNNIKTP